MKSAAIRNISGRRRKLRAQRGELDWGDVAREWNRRSGENLSRARVWQIGQDALRKLAVAMGTEEIE